MMSVSFHLRLGIEFRVEHRISVRIPGLGSITSQAAQGSSLKESTFAVAAAVQGLGVFKKNLACSFPPFFNLIQVD